jgi:Tol biopolymer transport system component
MLLLGGDFQPTDPTWSPDGKSIAYGGASTVGATRGSVRTEIRIMNLDTKESRTVPGSQGLYSPRWSPDGTHIAALSEDQEVLFLYSFDTSRWKQLPLPKLPRSGAIGWPAWSHDGCNLYIMRDDLNIYKVRISDGKAEVAVSAAGIDIIVPVFPWGVWFELTPDDRVIVLRDRGTDEIYAIDVEYR